MSVGLKKILRFHFPPKRVYGQGVLILLLMFFEALNPSISYAQSVVEFPDQELAVESVLPVFDKVVSVRGRRIKSKGKTEIGVFSGFSLVEPFYSQYSLGLSATYNLDETHALHSSFFYWLGGLTSQAESLKDSQGVYLEKAPQPQFLVTLDYQYSAFYGKISLAKNKVINTHLYGLVGGGMMYEGGEGSLAFSGGFGQKFYFSQKWALRVDFRGVFNQGPNPLKGPNGRPPNASSGTLSPSEFEKRLNFSTLLSVGMNYRF